ncbi:MAG: SDR family NAD(P)-dependent oxidoreductase, partial [Burkholderiales bacterium]|nr:SDR family NAD(P)-dependent oxidoreductase [Burkholderiales bacterium]
MNRIDLEGRVAVITGGAQGIGLAVAERMLASGAKVALWDVAADKLESTRGALTASGMVNGVETEAVELSDAAAVDAATASTLAKLGRIDILVNSAGITG